MTVRTITRRSSRAQQATARVRAFLTRVRDVADDGMTTAEYAVGTLAAVAFAGLLVTLLSSSQVREMLLALVRTALQVP